jgi:hypothetical protein
VTVTIKDKDLDGRKVVIGAQRLGRMTFLNRFLPITKDPTSVQIGKAAEKEKPQGDGGLPGTINPGGNMAIVGSNFGAQKGRVLLDGNEVTTESWTDTKIVVKLPKGLIPGNPVNVRAFSADKRSINLNPAQTFVADIQMEGTTGETAGGTGTIDPSTTGGQGDPTTSGGTGGGPGGGTAGGTGTTGGGTTGGTTIPSSGELPGTYNLLLSDNRADYVKAAEQTRTAKTPGALAVRAYALAALNRVDEAMAAAKRATRALGERESGKDAALVYLAMAKAVENANPAEAIGGYAEADKEVDKSAPGFVFKDIVIARFKVAQKSNFEAKIILQDAMKKNPTRAEQTAIQRMLRQVGG